MEKLVKLLNEYRPAEENCSYELYDRWVDIKKQTPQIRYVENTYAEGSVRENQTLYFISKKGGFIKWLVENDKIDKKKFEDEFFACGCCGYKLLSTRETCAACGDEVLDIYEALLMRLSIQDKPIEFLISILK